MKQTIGASLICLNHINFQEDVRTLEALNINYLHIDVMDGVFVPRFGIYPEIVDSLEKVSDIKMDVHLMVSDVEFGINEFSKFDCVEYISFHLDQNKGSVSKYSDMIRLSNKKSVVVLDLDSDPSDAVNLVNDNMVDGIMLMGIHPGVLIQEHKPKIVLKKAEFILNKIDEEIFFQVDGAVNFNTMAAFAKAGINNFVYGSSSLFTNMALDDSSSIRAEKIGENFKKIQSLLDD